VHAVHSPCGLQIGCVGVWQSVELVQSGVGEVVEDSVWVGVVVDSVLASVVDSLLELVVGVGLSVLELVVDSSGKHELSSSTDLRWPQGV